MIQSAPLFSSNTLIPALQTLCASLDPQTTVPTDGFFLGDVKNMDSVETLRGELATWIGSGSGITGWLLTTGALHLFPGTPSLPVDIPLYAELHRADTDTSLNLRHTPNAWIWEELQRSFANPEGDAFLEVNEVLVDPAYGAGRENRRARYQIEWRLTEAPGNASPATFRPARSRFLGWA